MSSMDKIPFTVRLLLPRMFLSLASLFVSFLYAQNATMSGTVVDSAGAVVAGAKVAVAGSSISAITDEQGRFTIAVPVGRSSLSVAMPGFLTRSVLVEPNSTVEVQLQPVPVKQEITVTESVSGLAPESEQTATRLNIPLMNLPQSVTVVTGELMAQQGAVKVSEALRNVAGVNLGSTYMGTYEYFTLRGFTQSQVSTYQRDGARFVMLASPNVAGAEQMEVLKGPTAILYGAMTPGGVINIVSKKPREQFHHEVSYRPGSFGAHEGFFDSTGPLWAKKNLFYRANLYGRKSDSFRDYVYNDGYLLNPSISWRPFQTTSVNASIEYDRIFTINDPGYAAPDGKTVQSAMAIPRGRFLGMVDGPFRSLRRFYDLNLRQDLPKGWVFRASYNLNNFMRDSHMVYNTGFIAPTAMVQQTYWGHNLFYYNTFFRGDLMGTVRTGRIAHTVIVGGDSLLMRSHSPQSLSTAIPVPPVNLFNPDLTRTIDWRYGAARASENRQLQRGGYVQDSIAIPHGFHVLVGARYTVIEDRATQLKQDRWSPNLGLVFRPRQWISLYGSYSESFETVSGFDWAQQTFKPSLGKQVEFGMKNRFFGDRLSTSVAWFDLRRTNVLTPDPLHSGFSVQSGKQGGRGLEIEARGRIFSQWQIAAAYAYLNMRVLEDTRYAIGNGLAWVPKHSVSLWGTREFRGKLRPLSAGMGLLYNGRRWESIANTFQIPSYVTVDANVGWRFEKHYRLQFNVKNLLDRHYFMGASNIFTLYPGTPRSYQGTLAVSF